MGGAPAKPGERGATPPSGAAVVRDVILRDGRALRLRSPVAEDRDAITRFFAEDLGDESRYLRFHGPGSPKWAGRYYAESDGDVRVSLLAELHRRVVAVAGYERLREPGVAEVAFAVGDAMQGHGLGVRLLEQLAALAAADGVERFDAEVLSGNRPMIRVFEAAGFSTRRHAQGGEVTLTSELEPTTLVRRRREARDHRATVASLEPLLRPEAVAVIGASGDGTGTGARLAASVRDGGFAGPVHAVNRPGGLADCAPCADLAVLAVPADGVVAAAAQAADAGARALVVVATGFADAGTEEGTAREVELLALARARGMRLLGPNSLGVVSFTGGVRLAAVVGDPPLTPGGLAISSQSGGLGVALLGQATGRGLGVASFAALGNRADVSTNDLLEFWEDDPEVRAVLLYVESFGNPRRFAEIARRVARLKPVLAVKGLHAGPAAGGEQTHTAAALTGEAQVDALFRASGVLRVEGAGELFDAAALLTGQPGPAGRAVAVVSNSGGLGTLARDALEARGLHLARLEDRTRNALEALREAGRPVNPLDLALHAGPEAYVEALRLLARDPGVDAVLAVYAEVGGGDAPGVLAAVEAAAGKTILVACVVDGSGDLPARPGAGRVPNFRFPERAARALALAVERAEWLGRPLGRSWDFPVDAETARGRAHARLESAGPGWLDGPEAEALLGDAGIAILPTDRCATVEEAEAAALALDGPVALKAELPSPAHASDLDAVLLGLEGVGAIRAGWETLRRRVEESGRAWAGAGVQALAAAGADVLVGTAADAALGPVMALGLGGRLAGLGAAPAFRLPPLTDTEADELLGAAPGVPTLLGGHRGAAPRDTAALRELLGRFALLGRAVPEVAEADLNPVRVMTSGVVVLDVRVRVAPVGADARAKTW